jgi:hypothetical protein
VKRTAFAEEPGTTIIAVGGVPGKPYEPLAGSSGPRSARSTRSVSCAEVADRGSELLGTDPPYALPLYNLACCESLSGRTTDAIEHLRRAIDLSEQLRAYAKDDSDFDPIREEPACKGVIGG